jgi:putative endonuclease
LSRAVGASAEARAARFLERAGYTLLERNFTVRGGELDLIARAPSGELCFVEVRARASRRFGAPGETVSATKQRRLAHAASVYLATKVRGEPPCRFDVIEVVGDELTHLPDAFRLA